MSKGGDKSGSCATKERLAGAIKVGFAQWRVDYTETVYDELICLETEGESRHAALGKYHVRATVHDERVLTNVSFPVKGTAASEDPLPEPEVLDVIEHKFDQPRDAESELRRRRRRR